MQSKSYQLTNTYPMIPRLKFKNGANQNRALKELQSFEQKCNRAINSGKSDKKLSPSDQYVFDKENLQTIIIEKKKMEILQKKNNLFEKNIFKLDYNSYGRVSIGSGSGSGNLQPQQKPSTVDVEISKAFMMDNYCAKMSQSIIMSSDTLDSQQGQSPTFTNESFHRLKFLGQGKFGQVHLVIHKMTGFICAMKIISKAVVKQEKVEQQLIKQIKIHNSLQSLNIIGFYGFFSDEQSFYILLEYATQGGLLAKFKGKNRLEQDQIKPIIKGICQGLKNIHSMGYVHRDIKPQNVVMQYGVPKICDFGWASDCDDITLCNSYCGTPLYLSPQMIKKQSYGTSVDIWAMGLIAYQLLVGRVPFSIWNEQDIILIVTTQIKFPQYIDRSEECEQFILGCLQKSTGKRLTINRVLRHAFIDTSKQKETEFESYFKFRQILG